MPLPQQKRKMLGEMLIAEGVLSKEQLQSALDEQRRHGGRIGRILKTLNFVTEEDIIKVLGRQMGIQHVLLASVIVDPDVVKILPETLARRYQCLPLYKNDQVLTLAMIDPLNVFAIDDIRRATGVEIQPVVTSEADLLKAIDRYYSGSVHIEEAVKEAGAEFTQADATAVEDPVIDLQRMGEDAPVVRLVNTIIAQAVRDGASDIHIEPDTDALRVRYRVDGLLHDVMSSPRNLQAGVTSRLKIMADLDIAEKRVPQDGRIQTRMADREIDIRLSTLPTIFGEKVVMRILDKSSGVPRLEDTGFSPEMLAGLQRNLRRSYGLILVTGPTGSGKTTTLYAALGAILSPERNIVTVEDPVEYQLKRINQVQVNAKVGLTFATGLRSILRQDPDVVMVGEIRDRETATIAIQAALTGHLVLSTLHTNDAPGAVTRLVDIGVEPYLVASSLSCVVAQRLVRRICPRCRQPFTPPPDLLKRLFGATGPPADATFYKGAGCGECRQTGYTRRLGIFEFLQIEDALRERIAAKASGVELRQMADRTGFVDLRADGFKKVMAGITTAEEVLRVTQDFDE